MNVYIFMNALPKYLSSYAGASSTCIVWCIYASWSN